MNTTLTALQGIRVGHATHSEQLTGCTVIMFDKNLPVAYKAYGGVAGTYNTENLRSGMSYASRDGLFIAGGSINGLAAGPRIAEHMIAEQRGLQVGKTILPSISGAVVWDLSVGQSNFDPAYGAEAMVHCSREEVPSGNVGAGTGTTVGKFYSLENGQKSGGMKTGVGNARVDPGKGIIVCALTVLNAVGNIFTPEGTILAGNRDGQGKFKYFDNSADKTIASPSNTTITIIGTNADLGSRENYERLAHFASHGHVRSISPVHTSLDGDTIFVFSTAEHKQYFDENNDSIADTNSLRHMTDVIGHAAAQAVQDSVYDACRQATGITSETAYQGIFPSANDYYS